MRVDIEGALERKQELQTGGKKATIRSWKSYYTVLCGQLLCFFKDKQGRICPAVYLYVKIGYEYIQMKMFWTDIVWHKPIQHGVFTH